MSRCACGRFESVPEIGAQVADGMLHLDRADVPDICEVATLRNRVERLEGALRAIVAYADAPGAGTLNDEEFKLLDAARAALEGK